MGSFNGGGFSPSNVVTADLEVDSGTVSVDTANNRVGIGTTSPKTDLTIEGTVTLKEQANADGDTAAYGQLWVKSDAPCNLYFTDDSGQDVAITANGALAGVAGSLSGLGSTDNVLLRSNGTGGETAQGSSIVVDDSDNVSDMGTLGCGAITSTGRIISDNTTEATSTTDGSLQTDGGLSVAKSAVIGDDLDLLSDGAIINFGVNKDIVLTHVHDTGLTLESSAASTPVFEIKNTNNGATAGILKFNNTEAGNDGADGDDLGSITFWGNDDGTPSAQQYAGILAEISDASSGTEGGKLSLQVAEHDGTVTTGLLLQDGDADGEIDVTIGAGAASIVTVPGVLYINGTSGEALRINKADGDAREIVFENAGTDKAAIYLNSAENLFIRQEAASADLNLRVGSTNVISLDGGNSQAVFSWPILAGSAAGSGVDAFLYTAGTAAHVGIQWDADGNTEGTLIGGADDHGVDFKFFGETSGKYVQWDMSGDELVLASSSKLSFHDAAGGENIVASADGHLEVNAGTTLDMTAPTIDINASTEVTIDTDTATFGSANSKDPLVIIKNTTNDANGARLRFIKDKGAAGAADDDIGLIQFYGDDANQDQVEFARIRARVAVETNGQEGGQLDFQVASHDGEMNTGLRLKDGSAEDEIDVTIGKGADSVTTISGDITITGGIVQGSDATGDIYYNNASGVLTRLAVGSNDQVLTLASGLPSWADASGGGGSFSQFYLEDDDGTEITVNNNKEIKIIGSGVTTNWTDTSTGNDGDPYDLTITVDAAQTGITSLLATDIKIGEDDQTKIDFEDANKINFYANNSKEVELAENALSPGTSDGTALGTSSLMWSDLFLASGGVINFNNGDMTLTHSSNTLTAAGGTVATAALTTSTIVASGIVKTDDTTNATSTTDGSLQTDGGLSVALDAVIGDDLLLLSDAAVLNFGANSEIKLTHVHDTGLLLTDSGGTPTLQFHDANESISSDGGHLIFTSNGVSFDWPSADGSDGQQLTTDGSGVLTWAAAGTASGAQTAITTILNANTKIGRDSQNLIDFATTDNKIIFRVNNVNEVELVENALTPVTSDGVALGTSSLMWSDIFLASGAVANFNNGDMTLTHSSNALTVAGGTLATAALTTSTIVASGIVKTDDTTNATSTTDGSLQTDGGLSVALDAVIGDDLLLLSDAAVVKFGANSEVTLTHEHNVGLILEGNGVTACPVLTLKNTNNDATGGTLKFLKDGGNVADADVIGNIDFTSEDDGDNAHTYARILAKVDDMTGGQEEGSLEFHVAEYDGTLTKGMDIVGLGSDGNVTVDITTHDGAAGGLKLGGTLVTSTAAELNLLDAITRGAILVGNASGASAELAVGSNGQVLTTDGTDISWGSGGSGMSSFFLEDGDGTEVEIDNAKEVKFVEGNGININWSDTSHGSDADPYDLTFEVTGDLTGVTSMFATDIKIGEDDETKIDFGVTNKIGFYANNAHELTLEENAFYPQTNNGVALGKTAKGYSSVFLGNAGVIGWNSDNCNITHSSNTLTVNANTLVTSADLTVGDDLNVTDNVSLTTDSSVISMGAGNDVTLTHDGTTGVTFAANPITLDSGGAITLDSATGDIDFQDGGTSQLTLDMDGTAGEIIMQLKVNGDDLVFKQYDGNEVCRITDEGTLAFRTDDAAPITFGAGNDITITHEHNVGLTITNTTTGDNKPVYLTLKSEEDAIIANETIGGLHFKGGDSGGTDAILVCAAVEALATDTHAADNNAAALLFKTAASEAASERMRIGSDGKVGIGVSDPDHFLEILDSSVATGQLKLSYDSSNAVTAGSDSGGNFALVPAGTMIMSSFASVTAAGSDQAGAAAITKFYNSVSGADGSKGVRLPTGAIAGMTCHISNSGGSNLKVYPASGQQINAAGSNTAVTQGGGVYVMFVYTGSNTWGSFGTVS